MIQVQYPPSKAYMDSSCLGTFNGSNADVGHRDAENEREESISILQRTANPLRGLSVAEIGRYAVQEQQWPGGLFRHSPVRSTRTSRAMDERT